MASKRASVALLLCALLLVTTGFAASKKFERNSRSRDWNDLSLQSDDLPDTGSSVSSGGHAWPSGFRNISLLNIGASGPSLALSPGTPDSWNGGTGDWSVPGNWSAGEPGSNSDVTIYSGGSDNVTLDTSSSINTLTLGGATGSSTLQGGPTLSSLTIAGALTIGQTGTICACASSAFGTITAGSLVNNGGIFFETSGVLQINGDANNSGLLQTGFETGGHMVNITGTLTNGGLFQLLGAGDMVTIGSVSNSGTIDVEGFFGGSTFTVNGDVTNSGTLATNMNGFGGGNTITITGMLTNQASGQFILNGPGDMASIGNGMSNAGTVDVFNGSTLNITGPLTNESSGKFTLLGSTATLSSGMSNAGFVDVDGFSSLTITGNVTNSGTMVTGANIAAGGNTLIITGKLANAGDFELKGLEDMATLGSLNNSATGTVVVEYSATLQINGDATNFGIMETKLLVSAQNTLNIVGMLTNESGGQFVLGAGGDSSNIGGMTNAGIFEVTAQGSATIGQGMGTALTNNPGGFVEVGPAEGTLQINGNVSNSGEILVTGFLSTLNISGTLTNSGDFEMQSGPAAMASIGGNVSNNGTVNVDQGSSLMVGGDVNVGTGGGKGSLTITNGATVTNQNGFVGNGAGSSGSTALVSGNGSSWLNLGNLSVGINGGSGLLTVNNGGTVTAQVLTIGTQGEVDAKGGTLMYTSLLNSGTLDPIGVANLIGNLLTVFPQGHVVLDVTGALQGQYGQLDIKGSALLNGLTVIDFMNGFAPKKGDVFDFMNITGSGNFSGNTVEIEGLQPGFEYSVDFANGEFTLTALNDGIPAVPEPATLLVLIPGLLGAGYSLGRRLVR